MHAIARALALTAAVTLAASPVLGAAPAAAASSYSLKYMTLPDGKKLVARWNPCRAHTYKVNLAAVPSASRRTVLADTHAAVRTLAAKSGIPFTYQGATNEVPRVGSGARQSAEVIIAYTTPAKTNYPLSGKTAGLGGFAYGWKSTSNGGTTTYTAGISKGFVVIDTPDALHNFKPGFGTGVRRGNLLLHEFAHAVGLGHVNNPRLQMNPSMTSLTPNGFAAGDLAGLARVGRKAGCIQGM
jgi:hypothetical protein